VEALNRAEQERQAAHADLDRIPARHVLSYADIAMMINELGNVGQALDRADPAGLEDLYSALKLEMVYDASAKTVNVTIRPTGRGSARVRGGTRPLRTRPQPAQALGGGVAPSCVGSHGLKVPCSECRVVSGNDD
jgi:hypothetical protein